MFVEMIKDDHFKRGTILQVVSIAQQDVCVVTGEALDQFVTIPKTSCILTSKTLPESSCISVSKLHTMVGESYEEPLQTTEEGYQFVWDEGVGDF